MSYALDTNGQNGRYTKAARRHGGHKRVLQALALGHYDPANVLGRFQLASEKYGGLRIRSAHKTVAYFDFPLPVDAIVWNRGNERQIRKMVQEADVVHLNNSPIAANHFGIRKPMLLHHHGSLFRGNPERLLEIAKSRRMLQAVSTIDLQQPAPDVLPWLPSAYDVAELKAFGERHKRETAGRVRIVHCPTNRKLKHTDLLISAVTELQEEGLKVDLVLVEGQTWQESLIAKAGADIVFDQLLYGYGCNSIEAWCMGKPVISGADPWTLARMAMLWPAIPFEEANERTLKDVVERMVRSRALRNDAAARGYAHVKRYHDELPALERLSELYADAIHVRQKPRIQGKGATFASARRKPLTIDGQVVDFTTGPITVTDTVVVAKLRRFANERPGFGITETE